MKIDGLQMFEGSAITNMTVAHGAVFPNLPSLGEQFYKTSAPIGLYVYDGVAWTAVLTASSDFPATSTFIVQTSEPSLPNAQVLANLSSGPARVTSGTGTLSVGPINLSTSDVTGVLSSTSFPALSGDIVTTAGSTNTTLAASGVTPGLYSSVNVNTKGIVTGGSNSVTITGGSINGASIGVSVPAAGTFSSLVAPTKTAGDNTTAVATTAFVQTAVSTSAGSSNATAATYSYNLDGSVNQITETVAGQPKVTTMAYNADGSIHTTSELYNSVTKLTTYTYNADGSVSGFTVS